MSDEELKRLIEKYYNGESTEDEERALRNFFTGSDVPPGYETEKVLFSFYDDAKEIPEPSIDFETRILAGIDASGKVSGSNTIRRILLPALSAAAGILILAGTYFFFVSRTELKDTYSDPEIAYAETIKILKEVSGRLNRGSYVLEPVGRMNEVTKKSLQTVNKSTKIVGENIKNLDNLQKKIEENSKSQNSDIIK